MAPSRKTISVSVIMPTYNRASMTEAAVRSALDQTQPPDEVIVIDDGSTDHTPEVLAAFGPPVRVIRQNNRGRSAARNVGIQAATTDAVLFLDSDDLLLPHCIEQYARTLEEQPEVGVVYSNYYLCDGDANRVGEHRKIMPGARPTGMVLGALARRNFLPVTSMVRRSCMGDIAFEEGMEYAEDYDFWRQMAVRCQFQYLQQPLWSYRYHGEMTTLTSCDSMAKGYLVIQRRILEMAEFSQLSRREQGRAFCSYGAKQAMLGATDVARAFFWRAIRTAPTYPQGYVLHSMSLLGTRALQYAILQQRRWSGNRMAVWNGQVGFLQADDSSPQAEPLIPLGPLQAEGVKHG